MYLKKKSGWYVKLLFWFILIIIFPNTISAKEKQKLDHIVIYYVHPRIIPEPPNSKADIEQNSSNELFIGNKTRINNIKNILNEVLDKKEKSNGFESSIAFKIVFVGSMGLEENLYIDTRRNFEFKNIKGKLPKNLFKKLLGLCEEMIKIIDLKFQRERILQPKGGMPCGASDKELNDYLKYECEIAR